MIYTVISPVAFSQVIKFIKESWDIDDENYQEKIGTQIHFNPKNFELYSNNTELLKDDIEYYKMIESHLKWLLVNKKGRQKIYSFPDCISTFHILERDKYHCFVYQRSVNIKRLEQDFCFINNFCLNNLDNRKEIKIEWKIGSIHNFKNGKYQEY